MSTEESIELTGTTVVAIKYHNSDRQYLGVVIASDTLVSIEENDVKRYQEKPALKLFSITDKIFLAGAGKARLVKALVRYLDNKITQKEKLTMDVKTVADMAAKCLSQIEVGVEVDGVPIFSKGSLSIIGGVNADGSVHLFKIIRVLLPKKRLEYLAEDILYGAIGSGSIHTKATLDAMHHRRELSRKSAVEGAVKSVKKATDLIEADHPEVGVDYIVITAKEDVEINFAKLQDTDRVRSFRWHDREAVRIRTKEARKFITEDLGHDLKKVGSEMLGTCKKDGVSNCDSAIQDGAGDKIAFEERCVQEDIVGDLAGLGLEDLLRLL